MGSENLLDIPPERAEALARAQARRRASANQHSRDSAAAANEIGKLPLVKDPARKGGCEKDLKLFCETYLAKKFKLGWAKFHIEVIKQYEEIILEGGLSAVALPRGSGKTTISVAACLWALLYGHHKYVFLVAATQPAAKKLLRQLKSELESNKLIAQDFPEVVTPLRKMEGNYAARSKHQTQNGKRTNVTWTADTVRLPTIEGSKSSGAIVEIGGMTGAIRGAVDTDEEGGNLRPSLALVDDPQTKRSANSPVQTNERMELIYEDVLGLAGPDSTISCICTVTVIKDNDLADRLLDRDGDYAEWRGIRYKLLESFPENMDLWDKYNEIRKDEKRSREEKGAALAFYQVHLEEMNKGASVSWEARYAEDKGEVSALQSAMNLYYRNPGAFFSEYQNNPRMKLELSGIKQLTVEDISKNCVNGYKFGEVPNDVDHITMFCDVQQKVLFWMVCGWSDGFKSGYILDYGTFPDQGRAHFTNANLKKTLQDDVFPGQSDEVCLFQGLKVLFEREMSREWLRDDGAIMTPDIGLVDAQYHSDIVYQMARQVRHRIYPVHGRSITAGSRPLNDAKNHRRDRIGDGYRMPMIKSKREVRHVLSDVNYWKTFVYNRFMTPVGGRGSLSIFPAKGGHQLLFEHFTSEYYDIQTSEARGRTVCVWAKRFDENHWWDCVVGCALGAGLLNVKLDKSIEDQKPVHASAPVNQVGVRPRNPNPTTASLVAEQAAALEKGEILKTAKAPLPQPRKKRTGLIKRL